MSRFENICCPKNEKYQIWMFVVQFVNHLSLWLLYKIFCQVGNTAFKEPLSFLFYPYFMCNAAWKCTRALFLLLLFSTFISTYVTHHGGKLNVKITFKQINEELQTLVLVFVSEREWSTYEHSLFNQLGKVALRVNCIHYFRIR